MRTPLKYVVAISVAFTTTQLQAQEAPIQIEPAGNPLPQIEEAAESIDSLYDSAADMAKSTSVDDLVSSEATVEPVQVVEGLDIADPTAPIEVVEERDEHGRVKIRREMTLDKAGNYIKHGEWTQYDAQDQQVAYGKFENNKRVGLWSKQVNWGDTAILAELPYTEFEAPFTSQAEFTNGKLNGTWTIKDAAGNVASEWIYVDGKLDGKASWYYPDGSVREEIDYSKGLIDGKYRLLDQNGTELTNENYEGGRKLATKQDLYENGVIRWEGMFLHETFVIAKADDYWETSPVSYRKVGEPERHGEFTSWYENGNKKFSGNFEHEVRIGEFSWWHENTQVAVKGSFEDGERNGLWVWWHENGQKAIQGDYEDGKLNGPWSYWNADGKLERKVDYSGDENTVAVHSVPSTNVRVAKRVVANVAPVAKQVPQQVAPRTEVPVGTGVRVAGRSIRNPIRK